MKRIISIVILTLALVLTVSAKGKSEKPTVRLTASTHSIVLTWTQSTASGITGNKVYRGTVSGTYTLLYTATVPIVTYTDVGLPAATKYYYVVTAVASGSNPSESAYSNEASGTTLGDQPAAPTGVTVVSQ